MSPSISKVLKTHKLDKSGSIALFYLTPKTPNPKNYSSATERTKCVEKPSGTCTPCQIDSSSHLTFKARKLKIIKNETRAKFCRWKNRTLQIYVNYTDTANTIITDDESFALCENNFLFLTVCCRDNMKVNFQPFFVCRNKGYIFSSNWITLFYIYLDICSRKSVWIPCDVRKNKIEQLVVFFFQLAQ